MLLIFAKKLTMLPPAASLFEGMKVMVTLIFVEKTEILKSIYDNPPMTTTTTTMTMKRCVVKKKTLLKKKIALLGMITCMLFKSYCFTYLK